MCNSSFLQIPTIWFKMLYNIENNIFLKTASLQTSFTFTATFWLHLSSASKLHGNLLANPFFLSPQDIFQVIWPVSADLPWPYPQAHNEPVCFPHLPWVFVSWNWPPFSVASSGKLLRAFAVSQCTHKQTMTPVASSGKLFRGFAVGLYVALQCPTIRRDIFFTLLELEESPFFGQRRRWAMQQWNKKRWLHHQIGFNFFSQIFLAEMTFSRWKNPEQYT